MEEEKKLYPFKFCTLEDAFDWGVDSFKIADLGYRDSFVREGWLAGNSLSEVMDMYMDRVVGDNIFALFGRQFPFQVREYRVKGRMALRVSPDDELAVQRYDLLGKEKMWYIVRADGNAKVFLGFGKDTDASEVLEKCSDNSVEEILSAVSVKAGDCFHIAPGTVHAACGNLTILEVSESSPLDFPLCAWGGEVSPEEFDDTLGIVDALDFITYSRYAPGESSAHSHDDIVKHLVELPQFTASLVKLSDPLHFYSEQIDSCVCYTCVRGAASLQTRIEGLGNAEYRIEKGETVLVPAEVPDFIIAPLERDSLLVEVLVEKRDLKDSYINPDVPEKTPDDEESGTGRALFS